MSNIYSAKFMNEASTILADKVIMKPVTETYLFSALNILREMNTEIDNKTKKLYISIAEAESKEAENKLFANYFYEFKNIFEKFSDKVNQMKSRMVMNIENKVETWDELIKDDGYIANFDKEFSYSGCEFVNVLNPNYPRLNLQKTYQKEFDYLGMLMQDKSVDASPSAKMKIVATVANNFATYSNNENWIKDVIKDMVDIDDKDVTASYSQCIYNALRNKCEVNVDKSVVYTCRDNLCNYEDIIDTCVKMCDCLLCDVAKVAENISSYLFRNEEKKLRIKTDTDGVIDREYRLDTYSMNQLDLFLKNKVNQMRKILNIYSIALGIKFDTAVDYIDQCICILKAVKGCDDNDKLGNEPEMDNTDSEEIEAPSVDDDSLGDGEEDMPEPEDDDMDDDEVELSPYKKLGSNSIEEDDDSDDLDDDEPIEDIEDVEEKSKGVVVDDDTEEFDEAYLFESELFELEMLCNMQSMHESVRRIVLKEEDESQPVQGGTGIGKENTAPMKNPAEQAAKARGENSETSSENKEDDMKNVKNLASKAKAPNIIQKLLNKIKELWKKFKEFVTVGSKKKIEYLKKNSSYISAKVTGEVGLAYTVDHEFINKIKIPDLNYETMKNSNSFENDDKFYETQLAHFYNKTDANGKSVSEYIKEKALGEEQKLKPVADIKPSVDYAYKFCIDYPNKVRALDLQMQTLEKAEKVIMKQLNESNISNDFNNYFLEFEGSDKSAKQSELAVYFRVCSQVIAAQMTVYQKIFNEYYLYCKWWITNAGGSSDDGTNKDNKQAENNQTQGQAQTTGSGQ